MTCDSKYTYFHSTLSEMRGHYVVTDATAILWHLLHRGLINPWCVGMGDKVVQEEVHITHVNRYCGEPHMLWGIVATYWHLYSGCRSECSQTAAWGCWTSSPPQPELCRENRCSVLVLGCWAEGTGSVGNVGAHKRSPAAGSLSTDLQ